MGILGRLFGNDHERAARLGNPESATESAAKARRAGHRRNATRAARKGQAWEDNNRGAPFGYRD